MCCTAVFLCSAAVLTASTDVDVQVAFDNSTVLERLSSIHGVDDLLSAHFITRAITGFTVRAGVRQTDRQWESYMIHNGHWQWFLHETARFWTWNYQPPPPPGASMQVLAHNSPVGCSACVPWRAFTHTPSVVDDEDFVLLIYEFKASLCTDAAPAFKLVGSRRAVRHTTSFVVVMHTSGARCITIRNRAAAETLRVAALAICGAHLSFTPLRTLC